MLERIREARRDENGFTLIELLMVIVILGILAGVVVFAVNGINDRGEAAACTADVKTLSVAQEAYYAKNKSYATSLTQLKTGGFIRDDKPLQSGTTIDGTGNVVPGGACT